VTRALQRTQAQLIAVIVALLHGDLIGARRHASTAAAIIVADATPRRSRRPVPATDFLQEQQKQLTRTRVRRKAPALQAVHVV